MGVQQPVCALAERFAEIFPVSLQNSLVFVRTADFALLVVFVQTVNALLAHRIRRTVRLAAARDASAAACHHFDKVVRRLGAGSLGLADLCQDRLHIANLV